MNTLRRFVSGLLTISYLMLISAAVLFGQAQPQTKAQTQPQTKTQTQPQTKATTHPQLKAETHPQIKAETHPQIKAETHPQIKAETQPQIKAETQPQIKLNTQQPTQQMQKAIPKKTEKIDKRITTNKSSSGQCQAITKNGTRCPRRALPGLKYCREHSGK
jgi:polyribonucleotide nucleotidyltransferase